MAKPRIPESLAPDLLERLCARFHPWPLISGRGLTIKALSFGEAAMVLAPKKVVIIGELRHQVRARELR